VQVFDHMTKSGSVDPSGTGVEVGDRRVPRGQPCGARCGESLTVDVHTLDLPPECAHAGEKLAVSTAHVEEVWTFAVELEASDELFGSHAGAWDQRDDDAAGGKAVVKRVAEPGIQISAKKPTTEDGDWSRRRRDTRELVRHVALAVRTSDRVRRWARVEESGCAGGAAPQVPAAGGWEQSIA
jgi:hypothetical protein